MNIFSVLYWITFKSCYPLFHIGYLSKSWLHTTPQACSVFNLTVLTFLTACMQPMVASSICNKRARNVNLPHWHTVLSMYKIPPRWVEKSEGLQFSRWQQSEAFGYLRELMKCLAMTRACIWVRFGRRCQCSWCAETGQSNNLPQLSGHTHKNCDAKLERNLTRPTNVKLKCPHFAM